METLWLGVRVIVIIVERLSLWCRCVWVPGAESVSRRLLAGERFEGQRRVRLCSKDLVEEARVQFGIRCLMYQLQVSKVEFFRL